jgi:hypothetical protein
MFNFRQQQKKRRPSVSSLENNHNGSSTLKSREDHIVPSLYQPSRTTAFMENFMSHFVSLAIRPSESTMGDYLLWSVSKYFNDSTTPALTQAIYACITNFYGITTHDKSIQMQSRLPYIAAVQGLRKQIMQGRKAKHTLTPELGVLTSVLLFLYELRTGETKDGWIQHGDGAEKLLLMRGPEYYQTRLGNTLLPFIRYSTVR